MTSYKIHILGGHFYCRIVRNSVCWAKSFIAEFVTLGLNPSPDDVRSVGSKMAAPIQKI